MKKSFLILSCLLSGCSFFEQNEPLPLYTLKGGAYEQINILSAPLAVDMPITEPSLNTIRIALTPSPYQRDYLADGQWPDKLPKVFQEFLLESLNQRWGGTYVNRVGSGLRAKYILQSEIQDFSVYYLNEGSPEIHQKINFKIVDLRDRKVIAAHMFSQTTPVLCVTMKGVVEAFNIGLQALSKEAIFWMEEVFLKETSP